MKKAIEKEKEFSKQKHDNLSQRNSSLELMRIIAQIGVVILHYNFIEYGGGFKYVITGTINYYFLKFTESLFICAVNLFIFISAYFLSKTPKRNLSKIIDLIIQVILFRSCYYLITCIIGIQNFNFLNMLKSFLPINYFVILYSVLYIISPYLNKLFFSSIKSSFYT